jgi:hypothetical protein
MNATFRQARRFAIAALICLGVALTAGLVAKLCGASPDPRVEFPPAYYPMFLGFFVTVMLAGVAACLLLAGVVERLLRRGRVIAEDASPNGGPAMSPGNSGASEGPPSVS